jgi:uncharacterized protein YjdB
MLRSRLRSLIAVFKQKKTVEKFTFWAVGTGTVLWFLIRVIPKPSRAAYPCMRAAAPIMSGFVLYLLSLGGSVIAFRKAREQFYNNRYKAALFLGIVSLLSVVVFLGNNAINAFAGTKTALAVLETPNTPVGVSKGTYPGRVSWVMDKTVTNENCTNKSGDYWYLDKNTNQSVVNTMLANGLKSLSGRSTSSDSWDALFKNFNYSHAKGWVGYQAGEKIMIKINTTSNGNGGRSMAEGMNATPHLVLAILEQLIDTLHIVQTDITIGDPYRGFSNEYWNKCHTKYPNVHYVEGKGTDGREQTKLSTEDVFFNSDGNFQSRLPQAYMDAAYLINMPCLKSHGSAGISIAAKNHQGSVIGPDQDATSQDMGGYLHYDYPDNADNRVMGMYRHLVDYMAHSKLGGNTLVYIVDAIWSGDDWFGAVEKWKMAPFSSDWTSSLFMSQDAVAIESVGFDFLYNEYKNFSSSHNNNIFPTWEGVQDYIHQAADPTTWASGIVYDPDHADHHAPIKSLGVHEHWNDATNKKYSQNLGLNKGIELVSIPASLVSDLMVHVTSISLPSPLTIVSDYTLSVTFSPTNAINKGIIWESSDPSIATVDQNGLVKPVKNGNVVITAITTDGNKTATSSITVGTTGIRENLSKSCSIFPNPVSNQVTFRYLLNENADVVIEIFSIDGKQILKSNETYQSQGINDLTLNLADYAVANGTYLCKVIAKGKAQSIFMGRMIVKKN